MQAHKWIRVVPVTARRVTPVDHHNLDIRIGDQRIGERHPGSTGADHQVVSLDHTGMLEAGGAFSLERTSPAGDSPKPFLRTIVVPSRNAQASHAEARMAPDTGCRR
jgi:hypothetical protein